MTVSITIRNPQTKQLQEASGDLGHCRACPRRYLETHASCPARQQFARRKAAS